MFRETIMDIFADIWPMMFISSIILISIRVAYLYVKKQKIVLYKELLSLEYKANSIYALKTNDVNKTINLELNKIIEK